MNTTQNNWECFLKESFAFWKTNRCGLTPLLMAFPTTANLELNVLQPFTSSSTAWTSYDGFGSKSGVMGRVPGKT
jgi:hypothetical protein